MLGTAMGYAFKEAAVSAAPDDDGTSSGIRPGHYTDIFPGHRVQPMPSWLQHLGMAAIFAQGHVATGVVRPCEAGALLSSYRVGVELRCGLLGAESGRLAVAISSAAMRQLVESPSRVEYRAGLDVSLHFANVEPLLNVYLDRWTVIRGVTGDPTDPQRGFAPVIEAARDEWRLIVPVGISIPVGPDHAPRGRFLAAIQPEWTLVSRPHEPLAPYVSHFRQVWAVFLTVRVETWL